MAVTTHATSKKVSTKYILDAAAPAADGIFDVSAFEKFLHHRIKVGGKSGNIGGNISITREDKKILIVSQSSELFSGRYLKYLTKKFLKKNELRDWIRVASNSKHVYELKFFNVVPEDADNE